MPAYSLRRALSLLFALALLTTACGGGSDSDGADGSGNADPSTDSGSSDEDAGSTSLFSETDFAPVCRETGISNATDYSEAATGLSKMVILEGTDPDYGFSVVTLPDGWETSFEDIEDTELVACLNRVSASPAELCEGYKDDDSDTEWSIQLHDTEYQLTVREATTAAIVAESSFSAPAEDCPMISFFSEGDDVPVLDYDTPDAEIEVFLRPFVTGS
ncbi:MAG: hypothetical protein GY929_06090 [Actinomycetia bacterium]|nr:hypothetical protein [Actinomycetes bacterium]